VSNHQTPPDGWDAFKQKKEREQGARIHDDDNQPESRNLSEEERVIFHNAREAVAMVQRTFETWLVIARGVEAARKRATKIGGRNTFERILEQQGISAVLGNTPGSVKSTASRLLRILDHELEVMAWRHDSLTSWERLKYSAPTSVIQNCPCFQRKSEQDGAKKDKPPKVKPAEQIRELQAQLAHAQEELARHDTPASPPPMWRDPDGPSTLRDLTQGWAAIRGLMNAAPAADKEAWKAELLELISHDLGVRLVREAQGASTPVKPAPAPDAPPPAEAAPETPQKKPSFAERKTAGAARAAALGQPELAAKIAKYRYVKEMDAAESELDRLEAAA
jgi:hypothetical protein